MCDKLDKERKRTTVKAIFFFLFQNLCSLDR